MANADIKISQLPAAGAITGTELIPMVQSGTTKQAPISTAMGQYPLASSLASTAGAGLVGYSALASYGAGTVGALLQTLSSGVGTIATIALLRAVNSSSAAGFQTVLGYYAAGDLGGGLYWHDASDTTSTDNGGTIIVASDGARWKLIYFGYVTAPQFGAKGDGVTDDTLSIQNAIDSFGGPGVLLFAPGKTYKIAGTIYVPTDTIVDLGGSTLLGGGSNTIFETGYRSGGTTVSNFAQALNAKPVINCQIRNGVISTCGTALRLYNFNENASVRNVRVIFSDQGLYAKDTFYAQFEDITVRSPLTARASQTKPGIEITASASSGFNDGQVIGVHVAGGGAAGASTNYETGWKISGDVQKAVFYGCSAESCVTGVLVSSATQGFTWDSGYFEAVTTAFDMSSGNYTLNTRIDNNWFYNVTTAITVNAWTNGTWGRGNMLNSAAITVTGDFSNKVVLELPSDIADATTVPRAQLPAGVTVPASTTTDYVTTISDSGTTTNKAHVRGHTIPFFFSGGTGAPKTGTVAFCTISGIGTGTATIDSDIDFTSYDLLGYVFQVVDSVGGTINLSGRVAFATVLPDTGLNSRTVVAISNGGKLRVQITASGTFSSVTGVVRHM